MGDVVSGLRKLVRGESARNRIRGSRTFSRKVNFAFKVRTFLGGSRESLPVMRPQFDGQIAASAPLAQPHDRPLRQQIEPVCIKEIDTAVRFSCAAKNRDSGVSLGPRELKLHFNTAVFLCLQTRTTKEHRVAEEMEEVYTWLELA